MRLLLAFLGFGLLIGGTTFVFSYRLERITIKANSIDKAIETFEERNRMFASYVADLESILVSLEDSVLFGRYVEKNCTDKTSIADIFLTSMGTSSRFMQIRFLDETGWERIRADRHRPQDKPYLIADDKLQNKSERYYFKEIIGLAKDAFWYSNIDLNIENGEIERPLKPVLRVGKKIVRDGETKGALVINVFMEAFLDHVIDSSLYDLYLIDKNGYYLSHPDPAKRWSRYLDTDFILSNDLKKSGDCILNNAVCRREDLYAARIDSVHNDDGLRLVVKPKLYDLQTQIEEQARITLFVLVVLLSLAFPLAIIFARTPARLQEELDRVDTRFEQQLDEKVHEMSELNDALEQKVKRRTEELEASNAKLLEQATTDVLTGIANRRFFFEMSDRYLQFSHRKRLDLVMMIFDIDLFKNVNDTYGHLVGDEVLRHVVNIITATLRKSDMIGRIGGEEFAIILPESTLEEARNIADKIRNSVIDDPYLHTSGEISLTISVGISKTNEDEPDIMQALSRADTALYLAKERGRDQVVVMKDGEEA